MMLNRWIRRTVGTAPALALALCSAVVGGTLATVGVSVRAHLRGEAEAASLLMVWEQDAAVPHERRTVSAANAADVLASGVFNEAGVALSLNETLRIADRSYPVNTIAVSPLVFELQDQQAILGRALASGDAEQVQPVAVISARLWRRVFASTPSIVGSDLTLESTRYTIVGVMPDAVRFPYPLSTQPPDVWVPLAALVGNLPRRFNGYFVFGRPESGVVQSQVGARLDRLSSDLAAAYPTTNQRIRFTVMTFQDAALEPFTATLWLIVGFGTLILLLAAANLVQASIVLRNRDRIPRAIKLALGASRFRLVRGEIGRAVLIGSAAIAAVGFLSSVILQTNLVTVGWLALSSDPMRVTPSAIAVAALAIVLMVALAATLPTIVERPESLLRTAADGQTPRVLRSQDVQIFGQAMFSTVCTAVAVSVLLSSGALLGADRGRVTDGVLVTRVELPNGPYRDPAARRAFVARLSDEVRRLPGVAAVAIMDKVRPADVGQVAVRAVTGEEALSDVFVVSEETADTIGLRLVAGSWWPPVAGLPGNQVVVSESFAAALGGAATATGRQLVIPNRGRQPYEVIGVVADVDHFNPTRWRRPQIYLPFALYSQTRFSLIVRSADGVAPPTEDVERLVRAADPLANVVTSGTFAAMAQEMTWPIYAQVGSLTALAATAVLLCILGSTAVTTARVRQMRRELAIRSALGARSRHLMRAAIGRVSVWTVVGTALGVVFTVIAGESIGSLVYGFARLSLWATVWCGAATAIISIAAAAVALRWQDPASWQALRT